MPKITLAPGDAAFDCPQDDTIMRAGLRAGLGFPYECNVGSCGTCRFELLEGEVRHLRADAPAWTERDKQKRRYLGCQSQALGDCRIKVGLRDQYKSLYKPRRIAGELVAIEDHTHDIREFRFRLSEPCRFRPGQYALFNVPGVDGPRAYSMCNVAEDGAEWRFLIKLTPSGAATNKLFHATTLGEAIALDGPYGMAYLREGSTRDILCLAGGSGLSPMVSIARAAARSPSLAGRTIHFIYGGRAARDICGEAMLRELPGFGKTIFYHPAISAPDADSAGWPGKVGLVTDVAKEMFGEQLARFEIYFAGPPAMAESVMRLMLEMKTPPGQIHYDQFY